MSDCRLMRAVQRWSPWVSFVSYRLVSNLLTNSSGAMGMAAIGVSLWKYVMKYAPTDPSYFNRDRFVLSNGILFSPRKFEDVC